MAARGIWEKVKSHPIFARIRQADFPTVYLFGGTTIAYGSLFREMISPAQATKDDVHVIKKLGEKGKEEITAGQDELKKTMAVFQAICEKNDAATKNMLADQEAEIKMIRKGQEEQTRIIQQIQQLLCELKEGKGRG